MNIHDTLANLQRGTIVELLHTGEILVELDGSRMLCDFLQTSASPGLVLQPGDTVLVWPAPTLDQKGCVLGRVGSYARQAAGKTVVEAERELILRCGAGSVTVQQDGKVLIQGTDIVSNAKRKNRIRGGSVQIN